MSDKEYGKRPYMYAEDYMDMIGRVTDKAMFNRELEYHSEFKKPYALADDDGYPEMEHYYPKRPPYPKPPPWDPPPWPGPSPESDPGATWCYISCNAPMDCEDPIECNALISCGTGAGQWSVVGPYDRTRLAFRGKRILIYIDIGELENGFGEFAIKYTDSCGNECYDDVEVECDECPPEVSISWSDSSAETVAKSSSCSISVEDGLADYTWTVTGTGFWLDADHTITSITTEATSTTLYTDDDACGPANISVIDECGETTGGVVRCTTGSWTLVTFDNCATTGPVTEGDDATRIDGIYKLVEHWQKYCGCGVGPCSTCQSNCGACNVHPSCHATMGCIRCLDHDIAGDCTDPGWPIFCDDATNCCASAAGCDATPPSLQLMCSTVSSKLYEWTC